MKVRNSFSQYIALQQTLVLDILGNCRIFQNKTHLFTIDYELKSNKYTSLVSIFKQLRISMQQGATSGYQLAFERETQAKQENLNSSRQH